MTIEYFENQIIISSHSYLAYVFLGVSILVILLGFLFKKRIPPTLKNFAPKVGVVILITSVFAILFEHHVKIVIDKTEEAIIIIEDRGIRGEFKSVFEFNNFTHIEVLRDLKLNYDFETSESSHPFRVQLVRANRMGLGSPIELGTYENLEILSELIKNLTEIVPFTTYLINSPSEFDTNFFKSFQNQNNIEIVYSNYPVIVMPADSVEIRPVTHELPASLSLETIEHEDTHELSMEWYNRKSVFGILLLDLLVIASFFLIHHLAELNKKFTPHLLGAYVVLVLVSVISASLTIATFLSKSHISIKDSSLTYETKLLGVTAYKHKLSRGDIFQVSNTLTKGWSSHFRILTPNGGTLIILMETETPLKVNNEIQEASLNPKDYVMNIDVSALTISERLLLEEELNKFINQF
jgi:hypothetical protein